ncbi:transketolase [Candidatus Nitrosopelagicus sp.]|nr:transketolase [Candidatus Nitrosopelagicus sp.]
MEQLENLSKKIRKQIVTMVFNSKSSHVGSALSIVEVLVTLYFNILKIETNIESYNNRTDRDRFILSKAHGSSALYAILAERGFFPLEYLKKYYTNDGILPGHLDRVSIPGIEFSAGALGHGFSAAIGMAISNKQSQNSGRIFVLIGDGECNEGSIWEGIMLAAHLKLDNLTAIVDYNKIQSFGRTNDVINQEPIGDKWKSFGWDVIEVDGHNFNELIDAFSAQHKKPKVIISHSVKGKGISFMEDKLEWHYKSPDNEQLTKALEELEKK